jgi:hypothetical protein
LAARILRAKAKARDELLAVARFYAPFAGLDKFRVNLIDEQSSHLTESK